MELNKIKVWLDKFAESWVKNKFTAAQLHLVFRGFSEEIGVNDGKISGICAIMDQNGEQKQFDTLSFTYDDFKGFVRILQENVLDHPSSEIAFRMRPDFSINVSATINFPFNVQCEIPIGRDICSRAKWIFFLTSGEYSLYNQLFTQTGVRVIVHLTVAENFYGLKEEDESGLDAYLPKIEEKIKTAADILSNRYPAAPEVKLVPHAGGGGTLYDKQRKQEEKEPEPVFPVRDQTNEIYVSKSAVNVGDTFDNELFSNIFKVAQKRTDEITNMTEEERKEATKYDPIENMKSIVKERVEDGTINPLKDLFKGSNDPKDVAERMDKLKASLVSEDFFDEPDEEKRDEPAGENRKLSDSEVQSLLDGLSGQQPNPAQPPIDDFFDQQAEVIQALEDGRHMEENHENEECPPPPEFEKK